MLQKDLVYELIRGKDKVCKNRIWSVLSFGKNSHSLNKDSHHHVFHHEEFFKPSPSPTYKHSPLIKDIPKSSKVGTGPRRYLSDSGVKHIYLHYVAS